MFFKNDIKDFLGILLEKLLFLQIDLFRLNVNYESYIKKCKTMYNCDPKIDQNADCLFNNVIIPLHHATINSRFCFNFHSGVH